MSASKLYLSGDVSILPVTAQLPLDVRATPGFDVDNLASINISAGAQVESIAPAIANAATIKLDSADYTYEINNGEVDVVNAAGETVISLPAEGNSTTEVQVGDGEPSALTVSDDGEGNFVVDDASKPEKGEATDGGDNGDGETVSLTDALNNLQEAQSEEAAALKAVAESNLPADATDAAIKSEMASLEGSSKTALLADAKQAVSDAETNVLEKENALAQARVDNGTKASLEAAVSDAQQAVNADTSAGGARELQIAFQDAKAEVADHVTANGDDEAVAKALSEAITGYVEKGGDASTFSTFTSAYNAEVLKEESNQDFSGVVDTGAGIFTVTDGSVTAPDLGDKATADLRVAVREAAQVAVKRDGLNDAAKTAKDTFTADATVIDTPAKPAELTVDLSSADLTSGGEINITIDGDASGATSFSDEADLLGKLEGMSGIESAAVDSDTLTVTSAETGTNATLEVTAFTTSDGGSDTDPGTESEVTGTAASTTNETSLGKELVTAQEDLQARQDKIDAVTEAEQAVAEEHAELEALTELVDTYIAAGEDVTSARETLEEDFGIESLVELENGDSAGVSNEAELFLFSQTEDDQSATISFEDTDQLYIGDEFTFNADIEAGDNSVQEVFFENQGGNTQVQIEQSDFGSNAATPEVDTITLTGVSADDLQFEDGYISVDTSAAEIA